MIASSIASPATRSERPYTVPASEMTAMSVVPPPMSMIMLPAASLIGKPAPIAAAIGSSTRWTSLALTRKPLSRTARRSTAVISDGTPITSRGRRQADRPIALRTKCTSIFSAASKSAITPSRSGRTALMCPGVRPSISCASCPTASTVPLCVLNATMDGSLRTMPRPWAKTQVFAVPRSIAMSVEKTEAGFMDVLARSHDPFPFFRDVSHVFPATRAFHAGEITRAMYFLLPERHQPEVRFDLRAFDHQGAAIAAHAHFQWRPHLQDHTRGAAVRVHEQHAVGRRRDELMRTGQERDLHR